MANESGKASETVIAPRLTAAQRRALASYGSARCLSPYEMHLGTLAALRRTGMVETFRDERSGCVLDRITPAGRAALDGAR